MKRAIVISLLAALPAIADEPPMTAAEFDAYTRGKILYYGIDGERYGVEEYLPDRRVRWSFLDGKCKDGHWYESGDQICFVYEDNLIPQCWLFYRNGGQLSARFASEEGDPTLLYEIEGKGEMTCPGPDVGV